MATRRIVNNWMSDKLYKRLGDQPNTERTWGLLRDVLGHYLLKSEFVPVPFIEYAAYYNQLFVFTKKQNTVPRLLSRLWGAITSRPSTYKVIANLDYLINRDESTWIPQFNLLPWNNTDAQNFPNEFGLRVVSNEQSVEKHIEFTAIQTHARSVQPPIVGAATIHRNLLDDLEGVDTLYVITDVVFASYVKLMVRIGSETVNFVYDRDMPIGFKYTKYRLHIDGSLVAEVPTFLKRHSDDAIWLLPLQQPIPSAQMWDNSNRRYRGAVRRKKSNLTLPPLHYNAPANIPQRAALANLERSVENVNAVFRALDATQQVRNNGFNEVPPQNRQLSANWSMEALRGSDDEEEF